MSAAADAAALPEEESGWYLYGVVGADHAPPAPATAAVDPRHGIELLVEGPGAAAQHVERVADVEVEAAAGAARGRVGRAGGVRHHARRHHVAGVNTKPLSIMCRWFMYAPRGMAFGHSFAPHVGQRRTSASSCFSMYGVPRLLQRRQECS